MKKFISNRLIVHLRFGHETVQLFCGNISQREFSSRREYYQDFASRQDSRRGSRRRVFSWRDPGGDGILGGFLAEMRGGNFSQEGSCRGNWPPRRDPGGIPAGAGNLGGIPPGSRYLFYKGTVWLAWNKRGAELF